MDQRPQGRGDEAEEGGLLLDQPGAAQFRVVHLTPVSAGDRAGGAGRGHGEVPGHAHVHHLRPPEDGHEGCRAAACSGAVTREGMTYI